MRIDLVLLGLLITIKSISAVVELTVFLIQFILAIGEKKIVVFAYRQQT